MEHTLSTDIAKKLAEHASHLETLNRVAKAIASGIDLGQILQAVTSAATELSGARFWARVSAKWPMKRARGTGLPPCPARNPLNSSFWPTGQVSS